MTILDQDGFEQVFFVFPDCALCRAAGKSPAELTECPLCKFDFDGEICRPSDCEEYTEERIMSDTQLRTVNVRVEYDPAPIRHISFQCPYCEGWFLPEDLSILAGNKPHYESDIENTKMWCPVCGVSFGANSLRRDGGFNKDKLDDIFSIKEVGEGEARKGVKRKVVTWQ